MNRKEKQAFVRGVQKQSAAKWFKGKFAPTLIILSAALDERSGLECLEQDGMTFDNSSKIPKLPHKHGECRCLMLPHFPEYANPNMKRPTSIGSSGRDGGVFKQYLIARARLIESGTNNPQELSSELSKLIPEWKNKYEQSKGEIAAIMAIIFSIYPSGGEDHLKEIVNDYSWPPKLMEPIFKHCLTLNRPELLNHFVQILSAGIPESLRNGPYSEQWEIAYSRIAADLLKTSNPNHALKYYRKIKENKFVTIKELLEMGVCAKKVNEFDFARSAWQEVLTKKPNHKKALKLLSAIS